MVGAQSGAAKKIHSDAYGALIEALTTINWNKAPFEQDIRRRLRAHPELLMRLDFATTKRQTAAQLVHMLMDQESEYRDFTIELMIDVSRLDTFPNLMKQVDAKELLADAQAAVANLARWVERHAGLVEERERLAADLAAHQDEVNRSRSFAQVLQELTQDFLRLRSMENRQQAGREFETFLHRLFTLFDLEPTLAYNLKGEQIDGAIYYNTDHFIVEAKWLAGTVEAEDLMKFDSKVRLKSKNALGLFVSVNGFSAGGRDIFKRGTSFITIEGGDLYCVLEGRIRLDELLSRKLLHASTTGNCYYPAAEILG
ncbi:restriction endonuclease [Streptomyces sp. bgisy095]|uniref:restriction endonuclease n=1 Tax=unclassified Streptomyces TaxID=2593676 RepID=UPI003D735302